MITRTSLLLVLMIVFGSVPGISAAIAQQEPNRLANGNAEKLIGETTRVYDALMLRKEISVRWPDLPEAKRATQTLRGYDT